MIEELRVRLGYTRGIVQRHALFGTESGYRGSHGDSMIMMSVHRATLEGTSCDFKAIVAVEDLSSHSAELVQERQRSVALLPNEAVCPFNDARAVAEARQCR